MRYLAFFLASFLFSQNNYYGGGPNLFYKNMYTAREVAMGSAGISSAEGYLASLWNPALIVDGLGSKKLIFGFNVPLDDRLGSAMPLSSESSYNLSDEWLSLGVLKKINSKTQKEIYFGGNIISQNYNDLIETKININNEIEALETFNLSQTLISLSVAGKFDRTSVGVSLRSIYSDFLYDNIFNRIGLDAGIIMTYVELPLVDRLKYGFVLKRDQDQYNYQNSSGLGASVYKQWDKFDNTLSLDVVTGEFLVPEINVGTEFKFKKKRGEGPDGERIQTNSDGKQYYKENETGSTVIVRESNFKPGIRLYLGLGSTKEGIKSGNGGLGIELGIFQIDFSFSKFFEEYFSLVGSSIRVNLQAKIK